MWVATSMNPDMTRARVRRIKLLGVPAFAFALAACGGDGGEVRSAAATEASAATTQDASEDAADASSRSADDPGEAVDGAESEAQSSAVIATSGEAGITITKLSAEEAEANAAANQPNLQPADDALDIEVLTVADGGVATLREVVKGDRPVLLWFFAPH
jgi:hypothetical protein